MRLAILSDVHGNPIALRAVLDDVARAGGVDGYWVLGDFAAIGPDPAAALELVEGLPNLRCLRGNTDDYLAEGTRPPPSKDDVRANPALLDSFESVTAGFAWTEGRLAGTTWPDWLARLPLEIHETLPDGTRVLAVHAAPGTAHGDGIRPTLAEPQLAALVAGCEADLLFVGHTHWPLDRTAADVRVVNLGSVSNPYPPDLRAKYTILEADARGYRLDHRRVDYDHAAVIAATESLPHPAGAFIVSMQRGERRPAWDA